MVTVKLDAKVIGVNSETAKGWLSPGCKGSGDSCFPSPHHYYPWPLSHAPSGPPLPPSGRITDLHWLESIEDLEGSSSRETYERSHHSFFFRGHWHRSGKISIKKKSCTKSFEVWNAISSTKLLVLVVPK